jgi:hypothetical protein
MLRFVGDEIERALQHEDVALDIPAVVALNQPPGDGHVLRSLGGKPLPWIRIELSRELYLREPWFDDSHLEVEERRLRDLNAKIWPVLRNTVRNL